MPTKRTRVARTTAPERVTPGMIAAWEAGDYWRLWREANLHVCQMPDWNEDPPGYTDPFIPGFKQPPDPARIKAALIELAGPPPERWFYKRDDAGRPIYGDDEE